jgi:hypothetical protein
MRWALLATAILACAVIANCGPENDDLAPFGYRLDTDYSNQVVFEDPIYRFYYKENSQTVLEYFLDTSAPIFTNETASWEVGVKDGTGALIGYLLTNSGPNLRNATGGAIYRYYQWANKIVSASSFVHAMVGESVKLTFTYYTIFAPTIAHKYDIEFTIKGRTLKFNITDPYTQIGSGDSWSGYLLGGTRETPNPTIHSIPYLPDPFFSFDFGSQRLYGSHYLDRSKSYGYQFRQYFDKTQNSVRANHMTATSFGFSATPPSPTYGPLGEIGYITVSPNVKDVLPSPYIDRVTPSYLPDLTDRVFLDLWNVQCSAYSENGVDAVRKWKSPADGLVKITSVARDLVSTGGNGVLLFVKYKGEIILSQLLENGASNITLSGAVNVTKDDELYFHVYANGEMNYDMTYWDISIVIGAELYSSVSEFNGIQGYRNWNYLQYFHSNDTYLELTYNSGTSSYIGTLPGGWPLISSQNMHPGVIVVSGGVSFDCYRKFIEELTEFGLKRMSIAIHFWQQYGFDVKLPSHAPANEASGGSERMKALIDSAKGNGHLISLHENYVDMYTDSPLYNVTQLVGATQSKKGWFNSVTGQQAWLIAADYQQFIVPGQHASMIADYAPNAGFEDVDTCVEPDQYITFAANRLYHYSYQAVVKTKKNLWNTFRTDFKGPLFGEGREISNLENGLSRYDVYFAGYTDGHEAQVEGKMGSATLPEFAQYINKNNQFNNGMGYIGRYIADESFTTKKLAIDSYVLDRYRAQQVAFGHSGWISFSVSPVYRWGRPTLSETLAEYHLSRGVQNRYFSNATKSVQYNLNGQWVDLSKYIGSGGDVVSNVVKIQLEDDTNIVVNNRQTRLWTAWPGTGAEYVRAEQFSKYFGYYYVNVTGDVFTPFQWATVDQAWKVPGVPSAYFYCKIANNIFGTATNCFPSLVFNPKRAVKNMQASVLISNNDGNNSNGGTNSDGVVLRVVIGDFTGDGSSYSGMTEVYSYDLTDSKVNHELNFTVPSTTANQAVVFLMDYKGAPSYDTISTRVWLTGDFSESANDLSFTVTEKSSTVLPPNGFVAWNDNIDYVAYSAGKQQDGSIAADYSKSEFSTFARSRAGVQTINNIRTDGAVAAENTENGESLYFADVTTVTKDSKLILTSTIAVNGHVHLVNQSTFEIKVTTPDDLRRRITVVYAGFPESFFGGQSQLFGNGFTIETVDTALSTPALVDVDNSGTAAQIDMTAGQTVRISYSVPAATPDGTVIPPAGSSPSSNTPTTSPQATTPSKVSSAATLTAVLFGAGVAAVALLC